MVSLTGTDEGLAQTIHARHGYRAEDLRWGFRFADILTSGPEGSIIDFTRFHDVVPLSSRPAKPSGTEAASAR